MERFCRALCWLAMASVAAASHAFAQDPVGDRLVLSINNIPYTQRQVEVYISVKEGLRKSDGPVRLIVAGNWTDALTVFSEDMIIQQEAQRLGSFQSLEQSTEKFEAVVRDKAKRDREFAQNLTRLGVDDLALVRALETVLRVAAFRRSKDRQAQVGTRPDAEDLEAQKESRKWLDDLIDRGVVRHYQNAETFMVIQPSLGRQLDAL
jgi:hypothetical protein